MFTKITSVEWENKLKVSKVLVVRYKLLGITLFKVITQVSY